MSLHCIIYIYLLKNELSIHSNVYEAMFSLHLLSSTVHDGTHTHCYHVYTVMRMYLKCTLSTPQLLPTMYIPCRVTVEC